MQAVAERPVGDLLWSQPMADNEPGSKIQDKILAVLDSRQGMACTEEYLKDQSGVGGLSFKEALIRLTRRGLVVKWKNERYENYFVAAKYAKVAFYTEVVEIPEIYSIFGHAKRQITVTRSIPFVVLEDREIGKIRSNRYRD